MKNQTIQEMTLQLVKVAGKVEKVDAELKDKEERQNQAKEMIQNYT